MASETTAEVAAPAEAEVTTGAVDEVNAGMARALGMPEGNASTEATGKPEGETEATGETDAEAEATGKPEGETEADGEAKDGEDKGEAESPEDHGWRSRVDKLTAQKKEASEKLEAATKELEELRVKLTAKPEATDPDLYRSVGLPPEYITPEEAKTVTMDRELAAAERWLVDNADGFEGEVGGKPASLTPKAIQQRLWEIREQRDEVRLEAKQIIRRAQAELAADIKAVREAKAKAKQAPADAAAAAVRKPLPKPPPKVVPTGTVPARTMTEGRRGGVGQTFENHKKAGRSEMDAASAALSEFG